MKPERAGARLASGLGIFTILCVSYMAVRVGLGDSRVLVIGALSHIPVEGAGMAVAWWAGRRTADPSTAKAWRLISLALGLWLVGDALLAYFEVVAGEDAFPSIADIPLLAFYPCLAAGLLALPQAPRDRSGRRNLALDAAIVLVGASMVIWYYVVGPGVRAEDSGPLEIILGVAYPAGDLVLLFGLVVVLLGRPRRDGAPAFLLAGVACIVVADIGYTRLSITDTFDRGDWPDAAWLLGEYLFLLAATVQWRHAPAAGRSGPALRPARTPVRSSPLPHVAVGIGYALLLGVGWEAGHSRLNGLLIGGAALTVVVLLRQWFVLRENRRLAEQQSRLAAIVEASDEAIISSTLDGTIVDWNPGAERMYGYRAEEIVGSPLTSLCHPERLGEFYDAQARIARGEAHRYETVRVRRDGSPVEVSISASPIRDSTGLVMRASGIDRDITERRRLESLRDEFIANAAHELRTPLATLTVLGELLTQHLHEMSPEQLSRALSALDRQGRKANTLIANLLDLSQLRGGRMPLTVEPVNVADAVQAALEGALPPDTTRVRVVVARDLAVMADALRFEQILTNLLTNAYRYGGGTVVLEAQRRNGSTRISISDDGTGVAPHLVPRLFEPFTRDTTADGSGIGLALCRRLVEALDGEIRYEPAAPHGARFTVRLPSA